ncbi:MAG: type I-E CRISPR-associated protein Cas7/Cse4/CasC [Tissierellia bacterium]|nr:type I-E CRISPR-associated protein Cas7/Cse4/CasC [Tissierellia bacterium]
MTNRLFLDVHAIQSLPPSNINRDDTGSPKTAQYGGVRRARVSSQSWKKAIRDYFYENGDLKNVGVRSLEIVKYIADKILELDNAIDMDEALELADKVLNKANVKTKDKRVKALFFLGDTQARELAKAAIDGNDDKKYLQKILKDNPAIDIALFGRMVADDPFLNEDASCQVSHAISTHSVQTEFDFFTAVDDLSPQDNAGAGMLGTVEFNSSTIYRYANIAIHELVEQLNNKDAAINTIKLFIEAFSNSLPTGKINTFANQTLPQLLFVTLRSDRPINLVTAFEVPVKSNDGYVDQSIEKLFTEYEKVGKFVEEPIFSLYVSTKNVMDKEGISEAETISKLLDELSDKLEEVMPEK